MRAVGILAFAAAVAAGSAAYAWKGEYFPGLRIADNPSAAEQRAFVDKIFRGWNMRYVPYGRESARCMPLMEELKTGANVTYLEPVAFGATEKPQAVLDIEKRCPHLYPDLEWENRGSDPTARSLDFVEPVTAEAKTFTYGEPSRMTRNFALYRVPFPGSKAPRLLFRGDRNCQAGDCAGGTSYRLIDEKQCQSEYERLFPNRDKDGNNIGPALMWTVVEIKGVPYFLEAGGTSSLSVQPPFPETGPGIRLRSLPSDVKPGRESLPACDFASPAAPRQ